MIIFCDIDGVIADIKHRLHFKDEGNYNAFYADENLDKDQPIKEGLAFLDTLLGAPLYSNKDLVFITGRPERTRKSTMNWLLSSLPTSALVLDYSLLMRQDGDYCKSGEVKVELIRKFLMGKCFTWTGAQLLDNGPVLFIDDDPSNVEAVCDAFSRIIGLTFGAGRLGEHMK